MKYGDDHVTTDYSKSKKLSKPSLYSAFYELLISNALYRYGMHARILTWHHTVIPATHNLSTTWNKPYLPLLPSRRASQLFGQYSFPILLRIGG